MGTSSLVPFKKGFATLFFSRLVLGTHILLRKICMNGCENKSLGNSAWGLQVVTGISNLIGYVLINPPGFSVFSRKIEFLSGHEKHPKKKRKKNHIGCHGDVCWGHSDRSRHRKPHSAESAPDTAHSTSMETQHNRILHTVCCVPAGLTQPTLTPKHVPPHAGSCNTTNLNLKW